MSKKKYFLIVLLTLFTNLFLSYLVFKYYLANDIVNTSKLTANEKVIPTGTKTETLIIGGDVMLGRSVNKKAIDSSDFIYPFQFIKDFLYGGDIVLVNLESPIVNDCPVITGGYTFCSDNRMVESLKSGSVDVVNLSNNHIRNFGQKGIDDTIKTLNENGILYMGLGNFVTRNVNGTNFGFLGFDYTVSDISKEDIELIKNSDQKVDALIVSVHWGDEYKAVHNSKQQRIAEILVENGADVVVGTHPHWVQDIKYLDGKPVFYSLGNLIFDQMWSEETKKGLIVKLNFEDNKLLNFEEYPIYMKELGQPVFSGFQ